MARAIFLCLLAFVPILQADPAYVLQTIAGSSYPGDNNPATQAFLVQTEGIAIDGLGNVYIADAGDNRLRKISADGVIRTIAGTGAAGFSGDGHLAIAAKLNHPYGVALDLAGNVYFADLGNARVRKIDTSGLISTVAGGGAVTASAGASLTATDAEFISPRNVALDAAGNVYISDFDGHRVYQVTPGGALSVFAGTGTPGFTGDGGAAMLAQISFPAGLATDVAGNVYIADSGNGVIRRVWYGGISTVATGMSSPTGVALDAAGHLYVASPTAVSGTLAPSTAGLAVELVAAEDVASDPSGVLFLATSHYVQKQSGALVTTVAGCSNCAAFGDGGPATAGRLDGPVALAVTAAGEVYIAEQSGNRIRKVDAGGTISSVAGGDTASVKQPSGIALDPGGIIYFSEIGNDRVRRISAGGVLSTVVDKLNMPACMRTGPDGSVYLCDRMNDRILKIAPSGLVSTAANISRPAGLAITNNGTLYASTAAQVVQFSHAGTSAVVVDGLSGPAGLALTATGELLIAETGKNRVLKFGAAGAVTVLAGTGDAGSGGEGGPSNLAELSNPEDVAVDSGGNILIADSGNNRICKLTAAPEPPAPLVTPLTVVNAASLLDGPVAANEIVTIYGSGFDAANTQVTFDNVAATVFYADSKQLNVLVPATLAGSTTTLQVFSNGTAAGTAILQTATAALGIFTVSNGTGQAAALNDQGTVNSLDNPVTRGGIIVLFLTGDGQNGASASVLIGGYAADVLYAGPAPGFPGLMQINARVPAGFLTPGFEPVVVTAGAASSQLGVTIAVQ